MAERTRTKKRAIQSIYQDATTQTSPEKSAVELIRLKEEVNLLRRELSQFKRNQQPNAAVQKQEEAVTVVAAADSPQLPKVVGKGCNCKGKCASRVCGCVKKQIPCTKLCKCEHTKCQNQDPNKENIAGRNSDVKLSFDAEETLQHLSALRLKENIPKQAAEEVAGPSEKQQNQIGQPARSIFSPISPSTDGYKEFSRAQSWALQFSGPRKNLTFGFDSSPSPQKEEEEPELREAKVRVKYDAKISKPANKKPTNDVPKKKKSSSPFYDGTTTQAALYDSEQVQLTENLDGEKEFLTIDPMKPTHQLQRTPVSCPTGMNRIRISPAPSPSLEQMKPEVPSAIPPSEGIDEPQVNWKEHCAQLVRCKFCYRTFYPFRIEKHEACCQRV